MTTIGVISDTHYSAKHPFDPRVGEFFAGVEAIIHAGDVGDWDDYQELVKIAPVTTVMGNKRRELREYDFPRSQVLVYEGVTFFVHHGFYHDVWDFILYFVSKVLKLYTFCSWVAVWRLASIAPKDTSVIIFGHTHFAFIRTFRGKLVINPGAAHRKKAQIPSLVKLTLDRGKVVNLQMQYLV